MHDPAFVLSFFHSVFGRIFVGEHQLETITPAHVLRLPAHLLGGAHLQVHNIIFIQVNIRFLISITCI